MPFIEQAVADAKEDVAVPEGEYDLEILAVSMEISKKVKEAGGTDPNMVKCLIAIRHDDYPNARPVNHFIMLTSEGDEYGAMRLRDQKRFLEAFNIPYEGTGFDTDDFPGAKARCLVQVETSPRGEEVNALRLPRFKDEEGEEGGGAAPKGRGRGGAAGGRSAGTAAAGRGRSRR